MNYITNYWYYAIMIIFFALIRLSPYSIGSAGLDNAINDISIGAIASVLVAFLIAVHDDKVRERDNTIILIRLVIPFYSALVRYMELYCLLCGFADIDLRNKMGTFKDWNEKYKELVDSGKLKYSDNEMIMEHIDSIKEASDTIEDSQIILLKLGIIDKDSIDEIISISNNFVLLNIMREIDSSSFVHNITVANRELFEKLQESKSFHRLAEEKYGYDHRELSSLINGLKNYS